MRVEEEQYLAHYGVLGMKWGRRKARVLSERKKARINKKFNKLASKADSEAIKNESIRVQKAAKKIDDMVNNGVMDKIAQKYKKKYGKNYDQKMSYLNSYAKEYDRLFTQEYNKLTAAEIKNSKSYKRAQKLVEKYGMTKWSKDAKQSEKELKRWE